MWQFRFSPWAAVCGILLARLSSECMNCRTLTRHFRCSSRRNSVAVAVPQGFRWSSGPEGCSGSLDTSAAGSKDEAGTETGCRIAPVSLVPGSLVIIGSRLRSVSGVRGRRSSCLVLRQERCSVVLLYTPKQHYFVFAGLLAHGWIQLTTRNLWRGVSGVKSYLVLVGVSSHHGVAHHLQSPPRLRCQLVRGLTFLQPRWLLGRHLQAE